MIGPFFLESEHARDRMSKLIRSESNFSFSFIVMYFIFFPYLSVNVLNVFCWLFMFVSEPICQPVSAPDFKTSSFSMRVHILRLKRTSKGCKSSGSWCYEAQHSVRSEYWNHEWEDWQGWDHSASYFSSITSFDSEPFFQCQAEKRR